MNLAGLTEEQEQINLRFYSLYQRTGCLPDELQMKQILKRGWVWVVDTRFGKRGFAVPGCLSARGVLLTNGD